MAIYTVQTPLIVHGTEGKLRVSNSSRNAYTRCRRYYQLSNVIGLRRKVDPMPLSAGKLVHEMLARWYMGSDVLECEAAIDEWRTKELEIASTSEYGQPDKIEETATLARDVLERFVAKYHADREHFEVLAVEAPFVVPLPAPTESGAWRADRRYAYTGVFDLVVRDLRTGQVVIYDHKTTTDTNLDAFEKNARDGGHGQRVGYVYAARYFFGSDVCALGYDVIRKKIPSRVETTQCPTCKGVGSVDGEPCVAGASFAIYKAGEKKGQAKPTCNGSGIGGLSSKVPDTTAVLYRQAVDALRAKNPGLDLANFDPALAELLTRGDRFLYRFVMAVAEDEIWRWARDLHAITHEMGRSVAKFARNPGDETHWFRNLDACNPIGRRCVYFNICMYGGEDAQNWERVPVDPFQPAEAAFGITQEEE